MTATTLTDRAIVRLSGQDVREFLPLLEQERWYTQTQNGYARGWEPVHFVEQVRGYLAVLEWYGNNPTAGAPTTQLQSTTARN